MRATNLHGPGRQTVRRELLKQADVHTLLHLPTGIFYAQGVKANVLFFDRKPAAEKPWTDKLWIYDLREFKRDVVSMHERVAPRQYLLASDYDRQ
jgi:type I restriction-modification system DNA methylase subunit